MRVCRTEHSPVLVVRCAACGQCETLPHSCGHRSCPHCQHHEGQQWLERQRAKLLPVDYFMVTFTLPRQLRPLAWQHQRLVYDLLLKLAWQTLSDFGLNDARLQGKIGAHAVLHTHSRRLDFDPHVHSPKKIEKPPIPCKICGGIMEIIATRIRRLLQPIPRLQPT